MLDTSAPLTAASSSTAIAGVGATASPTKDEKPLTERWLILDTLSHSERFRSAFQTGHQPGAPSQGGYHVFENGQQRSVIQGQIKLDAEAKYKIAFRASSGRYFNWAYADYAGAGFGTRTNDIAAYTPVFSPSQNDDAYQAFCLNGPPCDPNGTNQYILVYSNGWEFYVRELFLSATPVKAVTVEFGSMGIEKGYSSEITTFDDDGYISGERIRIHDSRHLFFDEIGFTNAFFGATTVPNLFSRGLSLGKSNYRQVFANKKITSRISASAEYTWQTGTDTTREAVSMHLPEIKVANNIRVELYQRLNTVNLQSQNYKGGSGFAVVTDKKVGKLSGDLGFDHVDGNYCAYGDSWAACSFHFALNGDSYTEGTRYFSHVSYKITPALSASAFYTHAIGHDIPNFNQQNLNVGLNLDLKALANSGRRIF